MSVIIININGLTFHLGDKNCQDLLKKNSCIYKSYTKFQDTEKLKDDKKIHKANIKTFSMKL